MNNLSHHEIIQTLLDDAGFDHLLLHRVSDGIPFDAVAQRDEGFHLGVVVAVPLDVELGKVEHVFEVADDERHLAVVAVRHEREDPKEALVKGRPGFQVDGVLEQGPDVGNLDAVRCKGAVGLHLVLGGFGQEPLHGL